MSIRYLKIGDIAFEEVAEMEKLKKYAKDGWQLESTVLGPYYRLHEEIPQNLEYRLVYEETLDKELLDSLKESGWTFATSINSISHIFVAEAGTEEIYKNKEELIKKYTVPKEKYRKSIKLSIIILLIILILLYLIMEPILYFILGVPIVVMGSIPVLGKINLYKKFQNSIDEINKFGYPKDTIKEPKIIKYLTFFNMLLIIPAIHCREKGWVIALIIIIPIIECFVYNWINKRSANTVE